MYTQIIELYFTVWSVSGIAQDCPLAPLFMLMKPGSDWNCRLEPLNVLNVITWTGVKELGYEVYYFLVFSKFCLDCILI